MPLVNEAALFTPWQNTNGASRQRRKAGPMRRPWTMRSPLSPLSTASRRQLAPVCLSVWRPSPCRFPQKDPRWWSDGKGDSRSTVTHVCSRQNSRRSSGKATTNYIPTNFKESCNTPWGTSSLGWATVSSATINISGATSRPGCATRYATCFRPRSPGAPDLPINCKEAITGSSPSLTTCASSNPHGLT